MAEEQDDLLNPDEIEALLKSSGAGPSTGGASAPRPGGAPATGGSTSKAPAGGPAGLKDVLGDNDIEALLQQQSEGRSGNPPRARGSAEELLDRAEADLAAAIAPDMRGSRAAASRLAGAKPFEFEQFHSTSGADDASGLGALEEVELDLRIELGRTELLIEDVLKLREGSVVPLDKLAGDPVDILVNGRLIARGEVLVLNDNFCVRVAEILTPTFP